MALSMHHRQAAAAAAAPATTPAISRPVRAATLRQQRGSSVVSRGAATDELGFELMRDGIKKAAADSILTPRFYTTGAGEGCGQPGGDGCSGRGQRAC
jgi:magnesium-protoporphyrin IX monomethyl ester (oxidative) cyclase